MADGIDLFLSEGDEALAVSAPDAAIRSHIKTEVTDGLLSVWFDGRGNRWPGNSHQPLKVYVSYKRLKALGAAGGADVTAEGVIKSSTLTIHVSGGSDFKGKVEVQELNVHQSGGSDVSISGQATSLLVSASGGSDFDGSRLFTDTASIKASGGSDALVMANHALTAEASGGSDIFYKGSPARLSISKSGSSEIKKSDRK